MQVSLLLDPEHNMCRFLSNKIQNTACAGFSLVRSRTQHVQVSLLLDPEHKVSDNTTDFQHVLFRSFFTLGPAHKMSDYAIDVNQVNTRISNLPLTKKCQILRVRKCGRPQACACAGTIQNTVSDSATDLKRLGLCMQVQFRAQIVR